MKALVTGAGGFLGTWLVRLLLERGHAVRAMVRRPLGAAAALGLEEARGDVTDPRAVARAVEGCDWVFHLAGVRRAVRREEFFAVNAGATRLLLEACLATSPRPRRFVLAGSLAAAGPSREGKREEDGFDPREWYGASKAEAERIALSHRGELAVSVARPARVTGAGDRENLFFFRLAKRGVILGVRGERRRVLEHGLDVSHLRAIGLVVPLKHDPHQRACAEGDQHLRSRKHGCPEALRYAVSEKLVQRAPGVREHADVAR